MDLQVLCEVEMKRMCLSQANADLAEAAEKLEAIRKKLAVRLKIIMASTSFSEQPLVIIVFHFPAVVVLKELDGSLEILTTAFEKATSEKLRFQQEVNLTNTTIELANRLVKGLEVINS